MPERDETRDPEQERREIQAFLGQLHGLLRTALHPLEDDPKWFPSTELQDQLNEAYLDCGAAFGQVQGELNSGKFDKKLADRGLHGPQCRLKITAWLRNVRAFYKTKGKGPLLRALRWANVMLGSLGIVPGADLIKEFTESVVLALEEPGSGNVADEGV
jgi:hypothetical protein